MGALLEKALAGSTFQKYAQDIHASKFNRPSPYVVRCNNELTGEGDEGEYWHLF